MRAIYKVTFRLGRYWVTRKTTYRRQRHEITAKEFIEHVNCAAIGYEKKVIDLWKQKHEAYLTTLENAA